MDLSAKKCVPCEGGMSPLSTEQIGEYMQNISTDWELCDDMKIKKTFSFKDFRESIGFVNKVADVADMEGHHPDMSIHYNKVEIELYTHAVKGLSENDFILAAKIDELL